MIEKKTIVRDTQNLVDIALRAWVDKEGLRANSYATPELSRIVDNRVGHTESYSIRSSLSYGKDIQGYRSFRVPTKHSQLLLYNENHTTSTKKLCRHRRIEGRL